MNFFEHQREAKKYSQRLVFFFFVTVALLIVATSVAVIFVTRFSGVCSSPDQLFQGIRYCGFELSILSTSAVCILLLVVGGSLIKFLELRHDPDAVAKAIGGKLVEPGSPDPLRRRLINVVEEMAIASGVPVPRVYIIEGEQSLNALASGTDIHHSLVAVTEGLLHSLNREELQAVIAHEFSHIVHGDMNLNRKLLVVVFGISMISMFGAGIVRSLTVRRHLVMGSSRNRKGDATPHLIFLGMMVFVIGYLGLLMSRILKASISRQREYLADASAVQYTRNPMALGSCFKKILAHGNRQLIEDKSQENYSHMFFANSFFKGRRPWFSTHPPLEDRIKRVDPSFNYRNFMKSDAKKLAEQLSQSIDSKVSAKKTPSLSKKLKGSQTILASLGSLNDDSIEMATTLRSALPRRVEQLARDPLNAQELVEALFLSEDSQVRTRQLMELAPENVVKRRKLVQLFSNLTVLDEHQQMVAFEIALSSLKYFLNDSQTFLTELQSLIQMKETRCLQDFLAFEYVRQYLSPAGPPEKKIRLAQGGEQLTGLLALLVRESVPPAQREGMWRSVAKEFKLASADDPLDGQTINAQSVRAGLNVLRSLDDLKEREFFLAQALKLVHHDEQVTPSERRFMRLITAHLNVPMPLCASQQ